ncbi:G5 domain-containing protein [Nanchangia anserum]|uniref:G5 domain-containing protein n=1 Tax=Nanchangia anserum TaxID=2692125 RepID=A0A8I0KP49_9ACTO|nr:G5 domain-containing protein [Nanchangia anserum]
MTTAWVPRAVSGAAVIGVVIAAGAGAAAFTVSPHDVTLVVDGARRSLSVGDGSVSDALAEAGVPVAAADDVVPARTQPVREKMTITLTHAQPAWVQEPGETRATRRAIAGTSLTDQVVRLRQDHPQAQLTVPRTASGTSLPLVSDDTQVTVHVDGDTRTIDAPAGLAAADALAASGIALGPLDQVSLGLGGEGLPSLTITRIGRQGVHEDVEIPFETQEKKDDTLFVGQRIVDVEGVSGLKRVTYAVQSANGAESTREVVSEEVVRKPVSEVVRVGTRELPTGAAASGSAGDAQQIALALLPEFGFGADQFTCLQTLWNHESGWTLTATNPSSGAYGIPQALPGSKMASAGADWRTNPATQIRWGLGYIAQRYSTPCGALAAWNSKGWY